MDLFTQDCSFVTAACCQVLKFSNRFRGKYVIYKTILLKFGMPAQFLLWELSLGKYE